MVVEIVVVKVDVVVGVVVEVAVASRRTLKKVGRHGVLPSSGHGVSDSRDTSLKGSCVPFGGWLTSLVLVHAGRNRGRNSSGGPRYSSCSPPFVACSD